MTQELHGSHLERRLLWLVLALLLPVMWLAMRFDPYAIDGDAVSYMDIADLIAQHRWAGVVNGYWHPLYPACLLLGQRLFHPARLAELSAYYRINSLIFLLQAAAVLSFTTALWRLRERLVPQDAAPVRTSSQYILSLDGLRLLGLGLLVIASQRELTLGKVRPDGLLQALLLFGFSGMLALCRAESAGAQVGWAAGMGAAFGFAYLTKSFAFPVALLSIAAVVIFQRWMLRRGAAASLRNGAVASICFAVIAGPYIVALSHQKHRLDFGDSGSLNYAWYVGGTEKFHLEPWMTGSFGSSEVHLLHPERQLLASPGVYSSRELPYGTMPTWFDATYFNERIVTHLRFRQLLQRDARNGVLVLRYLLNHPEGLVLLGLLLLLGARMEALRGGRGFWVLPTALGLAIWAIYGLVNVEERYVTVGFLLVLLAAFAALRTGAEDTRSVRAVAATAVMLLALLSLGESLRIALEQRREESLRGFREGWQQTPLLDVARSLQALGVRPGDEIACIGTIACVNDPYWMRAAGVRTLTEVFVNDDRLAEDLSAMPNRDEVYRVVKDQGTRVLVGHFDGEHLEAAEAAGVLSGWQRLGSTDFYALPLNLPRATPPAIP